MKPYISIKGLFKKFEGRYAVSNISFDIFNDEFIVLFGPNGAGKTTILKMIASLLKPTDGVISINGTNMEKNLIEARQLIGFVSHETFIYENLTVEENLRFFGKMFDIDSVELETRINKMIEEAGLCIYRKERAGTLSRGMKQRLSIIRALIHKPSILLLDEPYTGLDLNAIEVFENLVLNNSHTKVKIMVSHNLERGFNVCNRAIIIKNGKITFDKKKNDIGSYADFKTLCEFNFQSN